MRHCHLEPPPVSQSQAGTCSAQSHVAIVIEASDYSAGQPYKTQPMGRTTVYSTVSPTLAIVATHSQHKGGSFIKVKTGQWRWVVLLTPVSSSQGNCCGTPEYVCM